ncbi:hypothetical protein DFH09DRAFT_282401 [Mycena vulgaris]|nr:hypothetical protein DFH09DRAFT_282401 [Mycena vulgaris]
MMPHLQQHRRSASSRPCVGASSRSESSGCVHIRLRSKIAAAPRLAGIEARAAPATARPEPAARASSQRRAAPHDALVRLRRPKAHRLAVRLTSTRTLHRIVLERASVVPAPRLPVAFLFRRPPSTAGCEQSLRHHPRCSRTRTTRIPTASARPRRRSTYPREHQRGQLSAAGIHIASNLLVDEERRKETRLHSRSLPRATPLHSSRRRTARRGPPPTPRARARLRRASPLPRSLPEHRCCKSDPPLEPLLHLRRASPNRGRGRAQWTAAGGWRRRV